MAGTEMSGRRKKPTVMKVLEGTFRADRAPKNEPKPKAVLIPPPMPEGLNTWGQAEWEKMTLELTSIGVLTTVDLSQLRVYCNEMGNYWECEAERKKEGANLTVIRNYFEMGQKHLKAATSLAIQFGLTPSSRGRISVPKQKETDPLDEL